MNELKTALVTGASRGIGRGIALALAQRGWQIGINFRSDIDSARQVLKDIEQAGSRGILLPADISNINGHEMLVESFLSTFGWINLLVNNAGMAPRKREDILDVTEASYDEVMSVNLKGPFFLTQRVAKIMLQQGGGMIINIGSISAYASSINRSEYCVAKAGLAMVTHLFADRLANNNVFVYEVRPGIIDTDMTGVVHEKYDQLISEGITPIRRWGKPEDVAHAVVALAEGNFPFSTGEVINVDGGYHLRKL